VRCGAVRSGAATKHILTGSAVRVGVGGCTCATHWCVCESRFALGFNIVLFGAILFGTPTQEDYKKSPNPRWAASFIEDDGEEKAHAAH